MHKPETLRKRLRKAIVDYNRALRRINRCEALLRGDPWPPTISTIVDQTLRTGKLAENIRSNNAILYAMKKKADAGPDPNALVMGGTFTQCLKHGG